MPKSKSIYLPPTLAERGRGKLRNSLLDIAVQATDWPAAIPETAHCVEKGANEGARSTGALKSNGRQAAYIASGSGSMIGWDIKCDGCRAWWLGGDPGRWGSAVDGGCEGSGWV